MGGSYDVVGIGCCAFDIVVEVNHIPGPDEKALVPRLRMQGGGLVATALVAAARLGGKCAYVGALGDDYFSECCIDEFEKEGIETGFIRRVAGAAVLTAIIVVQPATGQRMILCAGEGRAAVTAEDVPEEVVRTARVLHTDTFEPDAAVRAARIARSAGVPVTVDLESGGPAADRLLGVSDYVIVPLSFAEQRYGSPGMAEAAGELFREIAPHGGKAAVITDGTNGSWAVWEGGSLRQPAYGVEVVDTTGCGDVYHGAFALGVAQGWDIERILPFASATAALKCREFGGRAGIPTNAEVEEFLRSAQPVS